jgi:NAD(P)H-dependent FMN reductase
MTNPLHLAVILGSTREGRQCDAIAAWVSRELDQRKDLRFSIIDPLAFDLSQSRQASASEKALCQQLGGAEAFLVITPEYNHSFPAALKLLIDSAYTEWQTKPVGFVSYGGAAGGSRAVEQLRQVFAELHAPTIRDTVSLANVWEQFDEAGELKQPERPVRALSRMLGQLLWWAGATREAREKDPYARVA